MHKYWLTKHLITRINSSGLHWRGALLPFNAGPSFHAPSFLFPLLPCLLFSLAFTPYGLPFWQNLTQWSTPAAPATLPLPGVLWLLHMGSPHKDFDSLQTPLISVYYNDLFQYTVC